MMSENEDYTDYTSEDLRKYFIYLSELRESGITNMFGAGAFLEDEYSELNKQEARDVLMKWMDSFDKSGICMLPGKND